MCTGKMVNSVCLVSSPCSSFSYLLISHSAIVPRKVHILVTCFKILLVVSHPKSLNTSAPMTIRWILTWQDVKCLTKIYSSVYSKMDDAHTIMEENVKHNSFIENSDIDLQSYLFKPTCIVIFIVLLWLDRGITKLHLLV